MPRRQVIKVPGMGHGANPIPVAVRMGNSVYTGGISPADPATGQMSDDIEAQIAQAMKNCKTIISEKNTKGYAPDDAAMSGKVPEINAFMNQCEKLPRLWPLARTLLGKTSDK